MLSIVLGVKKGFFFYALGSSVTVEYFRRHSAMANKMAAMANQRRAFWKPAKKSYTPWMNTAEIRHETTVRLFLML